MAQRGGAASLPKDIDRTVNPAQPMRCLRVIGVGLSSERVKRASIGDVAFAGHELVTDRQGFPKSLAHHGKYSAWSRTR